MNIFYVTEQQDCNTASISDLIVTKIGSRENDLFRLEPNIRVVPVDPLQYRFYNRTGDNDEVTSYFCMTNKNARKMFSNLYQNILYIFVMSCDMVYKPTLHILTYLFILRYNPCGPKLY